MGWRGTIRSISAAIRRAEREHQRELRIRARRQKLLEKLADAERAAAEVEDFAETVDSLLGIHRVCGDAINWTEIAAEPEPREPTRKHVREATAAQKQETYRPGFLARILGREEKERASLARAVGDAMQADESEYRRHMTEFERKYAQWKSSNGLAEAILNGDVSAYRDAFDDLDPFRELTEVGCLFEVSFPQANCAKVRVIVEGQQIVPAQQKSLTKAGKLSVRAMPTGTYWEIYQDYVCGCILRVAREIFSFLPVESVTLTACSHVLNPATGHSELTPMASAVITRSIIASINWDRVDPSEAMTLFAHRMGFKRSKGFSAIKPIGED